MSFSDAVRTCFRKYVTFSGRASRPEYWWFILFLVLGSLVAGVLDGVLFGSARVETGPGSINASSEGPISALFALATLVPMLSAGWRRMHDSGRTGLHLLYPLIAILGTVSFASFVGAIDMNAPLAGGNMPNLGPAAAAILGIAAIVCALSPLIVLWWLTRPSDPAANRWGPAPVPAGAAA